MPHVIWDWNGTLFDDLTIVVQSVNATLERFDAGPIGPDDYRDHYTRPVHLFYDRLLGRRVSAEEWEWIDKTFHDVYRELLHHGDLTHDARPALEAVAEVDTQSLLSMWWHEELVPMAERLGVAPFMERIDGNRSKGTGEPKSVHLQRHLEALAMAGASKRVVMIGDSLDDARAAASAGVAAVLYDGGSHHRRELEAAGVPVAATLVEAVALVLEES